MKLTLVFFFLFLYYLDKVKTSPNRGSLTEYKAENLKYFSSKKNLQGSDSVFYINMYEFSLNENNLDLVIYYNPQIPKDISLIFTFTQYITNGSNQYFNEKNIEVKIMSNNISNIYTIVLDMLNKTGYNNEIYLWNATIKPNIENYTYNIDTLGGRLKIFNETNKQYSDGNNEISQNIFTIYITDYSYFKKQINLITHCEPMPSENINLVIIFTVSEFNETRGWHDFGEEIVKITVDNTTNIFNSLSVNYTIIGYTYITILQVNLEPTNGNNIYYIYYPNSLSLYIDNRTEEDFVTYPTIKSLSISKKYYINITEISLSNKILNFDIIYEPKITNDTTLILILLFNKGNSSEYIELKISLNSKSNKYSSLENINFPDYGFLKISSTKIDQNNWYNKYYTNYPNTYLYFRNEILDGVSTNIASSYISDQTQEDSTNNLVVVVDSTSYSDIKGKEEDEETENALSISYSNKSSSNISIGMIIGIIAGGLVVIGTIIGIIFYIKRKKKKNIDDKNNTTLEEFKSNNYIKIKK